VDNEQSVIIPNGIVSCGAFSHGCVSDIYCYVIDCPEHGRSMKSGTLVAAVQSDDIERVRFTLREIYSNELEISNQTHCLKETPQRLPCYVLDYAVSMDMVRFLQSEGACCCDPQRSNLARSWLKLPLRSFSIVRGNEIDIAILLGDMTTVAGLFVNSSDKLQKVCLELPHWSDFVVQHVFTDLFFPLWENQVVHVAGNALPKELCHLISEFSSSWESVMEYLKQRSNHDLIVFRAGPLYY
jgi:hypothetical protein